MGWGTSSIPVNEPGTADRLSVSIDRRRLLAANAAAGGSEAETAQRRRVLLPAAVGFRIMSCDPAPPSGRLRVIESPSC